MLSSHLERDDGAISLCAQMYDVQGPVSSSDFMVSIWGSVAVWGSENLLSTLTHLYDEGLMVPNYLLLPATLSNVPS